MVCDLVYTTDDATWGFPEIRLGCFPPVAAAALAALVGQKRAAELILTGRNISGAEAGKIGLANRAVAGVQLAGAIEETVQHLAALSPAVLNVTKKAMYTWDALHFDKGLAKAEKVYLEDLLKISDMQEGIDAFLEKRKPVWEAT
jgi:cyclohexa-1,5-dienecarbonyl-CoA hydratase